MTDKEEKIAIQYIRKKKVPSKPIVEHVKSIAGLSYYIQFLV
jgi:hypothetical protein